MIRHATRGIIAEDMQQAMLLQRTHASQPQEFLMNRRVGYFPPCWLGGTMRSAE